MKKPRSNNLLEPDKAVKSYLESLLHDEVEPEVDSRPVVTPTTDVLPLQSLAEQLEKLDRELEQEKTSPPIETASETPVPEPSIEPQTSHQTKPSIESVEIIEIAQAPEQPGVVSISERYQFPMQCLMFKVNQHLLSIPLIDMGSVLPWGGKLTALPHSPDWFLGLLIHREQNVGVVDTARFLRIEGDNTESNRHRHILVFGDDSWAITCDKLGEVIRLEEQDVKWSKPDGKGVMLGTIKQTLAQLLDPQQVLKQLKQCM